MGTPYSYVTTLSQCGDHRALVLTERDCQILRQVYEYRGCSIDQVHLRFWPLGSARSTCYRRVNRLVDAGYLSAQRLPSLTGIGSGKAFLTPGPLGRQLLVRLLGVPLSDVARQSDPFSSAFYPTHHLRLCDVRCALELAAERIRDVAVTEFLPEVTLRKQPIRINDTYTANDRERQRTVTLVPDGAFRLTHAGQTRRLLLEVDLGTIVPSRLALRLRGYLRLQTLGAALPLLFITTTDQRVAQVLAIVSREAGALGIDPTPIFVTTLDQVSADTVFTAPLWRQAGTAMSVALLPHSTRGPS